MLGDFHSFGAHDLAHLQLFRSLQENGGHSLPIGELNISLLFSEEWMSQNMGFFALPSST